MFDKDYLAQSDGYLAPPGRLPAVVLAPQRVRVLALLTVEPIVNEGRRDDRPQTDDEEEDAEQSVLTGDVQRQSDVHDDQCQHERQQEADLGSQQLTHVAKPSKRGYRVAPTAQ
jgi:hypothetical protein